MRHASWMERDERTPLQRANDRRRNAKDKMDAASDAYDAALGEWFAAIAECDRIEADSSI